MFGRKKSLEDCNKCNHRKGRFCSKHANEHAKQFKGKKKNWNDMHDERGQNRNGVRYDKDGRNITFDDW